MARMWLAGNTHNRPMRRTLIERYTRDMANGDWAFNGDAIRLSRTGNLLDGQHRLAALVKANVTLSMLVIGNLPDEAQDTMDLGAKRSMADQLALSEGLPNAKAVAAILRKCVAYETGAATFEGYKSTNAEMRHYLSEHPDVVVAADLAQAVARALPTPPSVLTTAYHLCRQVNSLAATAFYRDQVVDGVNLESDDPAYVLRRLLSRHTVNGSTTARRMAESDTFRYVIQAWDYYRDGRKIQKLQAPRGGWAGPLPEPS